MASAKCILGMEDKLRYRHFKITFFCQYVSDVYLNYNLIN